MNDSRWERIKFVFGAAMEIPAARWPAFLDAECAGDVEVRREVESLLASQSEGVFKTAGGLEAVARVNADAAHREVAADGPAQSSEAHALSQKEEAAQRVEEIRRARASGTTIDDDAILRLFPHLADELRPALNELRRDEVSRTPVIAPPAPGGRARQPQATGYSIIRELGRGGQAVVYLALQLSTGQRVALKVMRDGHLADERALKRFLREVQVLAELNHPSIVTIIDTGQTSEGSQYLAMKYIPGATLARHLVDPQFDDPADPARLLRLFLKICGAVNEAHQRGIVHRDLKPSNILIDERGDPHILDFGIARMPLDRVDMHDGEPVSIHGEFLGSLPWSSPEQAEGTPEKIDARSDVYSLGVILYQMLTGGRFPYEVVGNMRDVLNNIMSVEPTPPSRLISTQLAKEALDRRGPVRRPSLIVNESIERVVLKALAKKPESRYQTAGEFGRAIERYLAGQPTSVAGSDGVVSRRSALRGARRTPMFVGIVAVLIGVGVLVIRWMRPDVASDEKLDSSSAKQESVVSSSPPIAGGTASLTGADLLNRVNLSNDVVSGDWTIGDSGLRCELAAPANIRFGRAIEGDYKYEVVFTATSGDEGIGLVMTRDGKSFVWFMGSEEGRVYGFQRLDARSMSLQTGAPDTPTLTNDERHIATVEVRADSVQAYLDGKLVTSLAAGHEFGELWSGWRIGPNSLGITTYRAMTIHSVIVAPIRSHPAPEFVNGRWAREGDRLDQTEVAWQRSMVLFGDPAWSSYDFSVSAQSIDGTQGFYLIFHGADYKNFRLFGLGAYNNKGSEIGTFVSGEFDKTKQSYRRGGIEFNRWYNMKVEVRGESVRCLVDGQEMFRGSDARFTHGRIGLACWNASAQFREIRVTSPEGEMLWSGPPEVP